MKKTIKNALFALSSLLLVSCGKTSSETSKTIDDDIDSTVSSSIEETGKYIISKSASPYSIVIPEGADANVTFASTELQTFLNYATGVTLPIIKDSTNPSLENGHYISLGQTTLFEESGFEIPDYLLKTGYVMKRLDDSLFINARNGSGVYSAVYDFLASAIDLEIYSHDEYTYTVKEDVPLLDYNVEFKPLFDIRQILYKHLSSSTLYQRRMRLYTDLGLGKWAAFAHTTVTKYLPYSKYGTEHPSWYNDAGTQVCYSNPEVLHAMAEEMKSCIASNPEASFIQMGHEDNLDMCMCSNCVAERELYGGYGGQELEFTNKLEEILDPWMEQTYPDRSMKYVFFAYQTSQEPPAKFDDASGKYVPTSSKFRVNKNVMVMYCPIDADFSKKFSDSKNAPQYRQIKAWGDLFDYANRHGEIYIWTYSLSAKTAMIPLNNFGTYEEQYRFMADCGAVDMLDQSYYETGTPSLEAFKIYTQSRLQYTRDISYEELAKKFLNQYYGEARNDMIKYYNLLRSWYKYLDDTYGVGAYVMSDLYQTQFWSFEILSKFLSIMEDGIKSIEAIKESNYSRYLVLFDRLRTEECFPIYMMFRFYMSELSIEQKKEYWNILSEYCKKFDIISSLEGGMDINNSIESWRSEIFGD